MNGRSYAVPVIVIHVLLLESTLHLRLNVAWKIVVAIDQVHVHLTGLGPVV
jgi:hypothetical protein